MNKPADFEPMDWARLVDPPRLPKTRGGKNPCCEIEIPVSDLCILGIDFNALYVDRSSV
jgi:hypothetical protein